MHTLHSPPVMKSIRLRINHPIMTSSIRLDSGKTALFAQRPPPSSSAPNLAQFPIEIIDCIFKHLYTPTEPPVPQKTRHTFSTNFALSLRPHVTVRDRSSENRYLSRLYSPQHRCKSERALSSLARTCKRFRPCAERFIFRSFLLACPADVEALNNLASPRTGDSEEEAYLRIARRGYIRELRCHINVDVVRSETTKDVLSGFMGRPVKYNTRLEGRACFTKFETDVRRIMFMLRNWENDGHLFPDMKIAWKLETERICGFFPSDVSHEPVVVTTEPVSTGIEKRDEMGDIFVIIEDRAVHVPISTLLDNVNLDGLKINGVREFILVAGRRQYQCFIGERRLSRCFPNAQIKLLEEKFAPAEAEDEQIWCEDWGPRRPQTGSSGPEPDFDEQQEQMLLLRQLSLETYGPSPWYDLLPGSLD
ncbi:hypothetical protein BJ508DRAFT_344691 [Ascobolus immersus RN42]|uniref:Uncharacterized protein n=1 Tax=Ascobolus immersus RN42 TaxID=1160509 RepID=A0A3N4I7X1_ASCIM|nr:hypothetical protein BJ508DRAFT_344691 [Ascobolus immersus RN42]